MRKRKNSWLRIPFTLLAAETGRFNSGTYGEWHVLHRGNRFMAVYHEAGYESECKLCGNEPAPMDPLLERRMYDAESRVQNAGPKQRRQDSTEQNRTTRKHWQ